MLAQLMILPSEPSAQPLTVVFHVHVSNFISNYIELTNPSLSPFIGGLGNLGNSNTQKSISGILKN